MAPNNPAIPLIEAALEAAAAARWGEKANWPRRLRGLNFDPVIKDAGRGGRPINPRALPYLATKTRSSVKAAACHDRRSG